MTPCDPNGEPQSRQQDCPLPHAVLLMLSRRLESRLHTKHRQCSHTVHPSDGILRSRDNGFSSHSILCCSMASIMAARASTPLMISFSSSVRSSPRGPPDTFISARSVLKTNTHTQTRNPLSREVACKVKNADQTKGQDVPKVRRYGNLTTVGTSEATASNWGKLAQRDIIFIWFVG